MTALPASVDLSARRAPGEWAHGWLWLYVALLPLPGLAEGVLSLAALATTALFARMWRQGRLAIALSPQALQLTSALFLVYWLPQLMAAVDAPDPGKAIRRAVAVLRYLPFMWLVALTVATPQRRSRTFTGLAVIAMVWTADALLQAVLGSSPLLWLLDSAKRVLVGQPFCPVSELAALGRFNGIFSECNPKLGQVLAVLSPFVLFIAGRNRLLWALLLVLCGMAVLLAGARAAWVSYAVVVLLSGWSLLGRRGVLVLAASGGVALVLLAAMVPAIGQRVEDSAGLISGQSAAADGALAGRGRIWQGAVCMIQQHPVNGVGVRGFRHAWDACDPRSGQPAIWGEGPALHAHQLLLEILAETGVLGLLVWLAGAVMAVGAWQRAERAARRSALPAAIALMALFFPFNTHLAVYSAFWGGISMMLLALYAGALNTRVPFSEGDPGCRPRRNG